MPTAKELQRKYAEEAQAQAKWLREREVVVDGETRIDLDADGREELKKRSDALNALNDEVTAAFEAERAAKSILEVNDSLHAPAAGIPAPRFGKSGEASGWGQPFEFKTLGDLLSESADYKSAKGGGSLVTSLELPDYKTLLQRTDGFAPFVTRGPEIVPMAQRPLTIASLFAQGTTTESGLSWMQQTLNTDGSAAVAEGNAPGESAFKWESTSCTVETISATIPGTQEQFDDAPQLRDLVDNQLTRNLQLKEEYYLLYGTGASPQIRGITNATNLQTVAKGALPAHEAILVAIDKIRNIAYEEPTAVVIHPTDFRGIRLMKTANGDYLWGPPSEAGADRVFGKPTVSTSAITQGTAIAGAWNPCATLVRRKVIDIRVSDSHGTNFPSRILLFRIDERLALKITKGSGFCTVTGL